MRKENRRKEKRLPTHFGMNQGVTIVDGCEAFLHTAFWIHGAPFAHCRAHRPRLLGCPFRLAPPPPAQQPPLGSGGRPEDGGGSTHR